MHDWKNLTDAIRTLGLEVALSNWKRTNSQENSMNGSQTNSDLREIKSIPSSQSSPKSSDPSLSLPKIELRPINDEDLKITRQWRNNPLTYKWCRQYEPVSEAHHIAYWQRVWKDPSTKLFMLEAELPVGVGGLTSIDWINRKAEFSLYIAHEFSRHHFGEAALKKIVEYGFGTLNLNRIWGEVFQGNPAIEMFQRVGFKIEGRLKGSYFRNGEYIDSILIGRVTV